MLTEAQSHKFFKQDDKEHCVRFIGDKLECFIPNRYQTVEYLVVSEYVTTLGIFSMKINDSFECGLQIPALITMDPSNIYETTIDDISYTVCELAKNQRLITNLDVMQVSRIGYFMWREFLTQGNLPKFITHDNIITMMDDLGEITGHACNGNHAVLEIVYSHLFRDAKNPLIHYRNTDMTKPPAIVNLKDVAYGTDATSSRMIGAYSEMGLNNALINPSTDNHELEDLFRA